jgi:hypothetical protein
VVQFISTFFNQIKGNLFENRPTRPVPNEVVCVSKVFASQDWINWMKDENYRRELVLRGETFANVFLSYRRSFRAMGRSDGGGRSLQAHMETVSAPISRPDSDPVPNTDVIVEAEPEIAVVGTETAETAVVGAAAAAEETRDYSIMNNEVTMI